MNAELTPFIERVWSIECERCSTEATMSGQKQAAARSFSRLGWMRFPWTVLEKRTMCPDCVARVNVAGVLG